MPAILPIVGATARSAGTTLPIGTALGKYEIVQAVAVGGMAEIYLARSQGPQRFEKYVILKRILPHLAAEGQFVEMFLEEARLAASMSHANLVHVHDFGHDSGSYFFTMEYVHGEDVRQILKACWKRGRPLPIADALTIVSQAAAGLHYAHELEGPDGGLLGVVHRDVSPSNLLVTFDGQTKVADFGIAKVSQRTFQTRTGGVKGKVSYMSPEQCRGEAVDRRSDVFALGILLYELSTGHKLFAGENDLAIMRKVVDDPLPRPSEVVPDYPPVLERIVGNALARDPDDRYQSARELHAALEEFCRGAGLVMSSMALSTSMIELFGKRPHPWAGRTRPLAITSAEHQVGPERAADWDAESKPTTLVPSASGLEVSALSAAVAPAPPRRWPIVAGAGAALVVGVILALAIGGGGRARAPAPTPAAAPAPAPMAGGAGVNTPAPTTPAATATTPSTSTTAATPSTAATPTTAAPPTTATPPQATEHAVATVERPARPTTAGATTSAGTPRPPGKAGGKPRVPTKPATPRKPGGKPTGPKRDLDSPFLPD